MKKSIRMIALLLMVMLVFSGCGSSTGDGGSAGNDAGGNAESNKPQNEILNPAAFDELLLAQPLAVVSTEYVVQDENYKSLYPDMLRAIIQNNTTADIKDAVIAFVAWDDNGLPLKIKSDFDFTDGSYVKKVNYSDINLVGGDTYGDKSGYSIDHAIGVGSFKAIAVSFETFDGDTWENPYLDAFCELYEGEKFDSEAEIEVLIVESSFEVSEKKPSGDAPAGSGALTEGELDAQLLEQPVYVSRTEYVVQDNNYKSLYPDMLRAVIQSNTDVDIKDAVIAFVGWDANGLPIKLKSDFDFTDGAYIKEVNYSDINLAAGQSYGDSSGYSIDYTIGVDTFKAIVVSYETFEGDTWKNPLYSDFKKLYEGQKALN